MRIAGIGFILGLLLTLAPVLLVAVRFRPDSEHRALGRKSDPPAWP